MATGTAEAAAASADPVIEIQGLNKWYGAFHVLRDVNLAVARGEKILIWGPSGPGKTRLAEEFLAEVAAKGIPTARATAVRAAAHIPFAAFLHESKGEQRPAAQPRVGLGMPENCS